MVALFKIHLSLVFLKGVLVQATYRGYALIIRIQEDKKEGLCKLYYENGNLKSESTFKNDKTEGLYKTYYENGNLKSEVTYKNDELERPVKNYNENGELTKDN